ncbi:MAG TPA: LCP family protein [Anaerolineaceae bacterium]|nr:LCP family protein [Anaerolineaceae bacterium]
MYPKQTNRGKPVFLFVLLGLAALILLVMATVSVNKMRDGQPGFLTNLWASESNGGNTDPILDGNPMRVNKPAYVKTILFEGTDSYDGSYRTDVLLLAAFNLRTNKINLISFPRDLWVQIPNYGAQRINVAHEVGGDQMVSDVFAFNFGFRPDHTIRVDFAGFQKILQALGNLTINVGQPFHEAYDDAGTEWLTLEPGPHELGDGQSLFYVRARKNSSDFERGRRAQEVLRAMLDKFFQPTIIRQRWPLIFKTVIEEVKTDMKVSDFILYALPLGKYRDKEMITSFAITPTEAQGFVTDGGAQVLAPDLAAIHNILNQVFWAE